MATEPNLLSEVRFGAFLQYSPRGTGKASRLSRRWRDAIKTDTPGSLRRVAERLAASEEARKTGVLQLFEGALLVPAPRSAPLRRGTLWPAHRICEELIRAGLGRRILPCLERTTAVQKSAFAARGERPGVRDHLASMAVADPLAPPGNLLLIDDFVTRGATILASASILKESFPRREVAGFALVRTMGLISDVEHVVEPCTGRISITRTGSVDRQP